MTIKVMPFKTKRAQDNVTDSGAFGPLKYEIYDKWRTIHLIDGNKVFKKDCDCFESQIDKSGIDSLKEGESVTIEGSGDNANLIITLKDGELAMRLEDKVRSLTQKLQSILDRSKKKVLTISSSRTEKKASVRA